MPVQVDPRYFNWGGQFQAGIQQAQDQKAQQAQAALQQQQFGLNERRVGLEESRYALADKQRQAEMDAQLQKEAMQHKAMAALYGDERAGLELLVGQGFDPAHAQELVKDPDIKSLYQHFAELDKPESIGQLYKVGPNGTYATAQQAIGQPAYNDPGSEGNPYHTPVYTGSGILDFNNRTGITVPSPGGGGILKTTDNPAVRADVVGAETSAKTDAERTNDYINKGLAAADSIAVVNRGLELLNSVSTGGLSAARLKATNLFGVTGADEAELSANLGKAVLAQLRSTFGAQFTEQEGERLSNIEAGFGKSTEGNRRLLEQAGKILDRAARRGLEAAKKAGDTFSENEIRNSMSTSLSPGGAVTPSAGVKTIKNDAEYDALPSGVEFTGPDGVRRRKP